MDTRKRRKDASLTRPLSLDVMNSLTKRPRVHAHRKFAQGTQPLPLAHSLPCFDDESVRSGRCSSLDGRSSFISRSSTYSVRGQEGRLHFPLNRGNNSVRNLPDSSGKGGASMDYDAAPGNSLDSVENFLLPVRPKTEDFLTFLCFRSTSLLPSTFDQFNIPQIVQEPLNKIPRLGNDKAETDICLNQKQNFCRSSSRSSLDADSCNTPASLKESGRVKNGGDGASSPSLRTTRSGAPMVGQLRIKSSLRHSRASAVVRSRRLLGDKKNLLLKKAQELKSKCIRGHQSRLSCRSVSPIKRITRSADLKYRNKSFPNSSGTVNHKIDLSAERRQRAERRNIDKKLGESQKKNKFRESSPSSKDKSKDTRNRSLEIQQESIEHSSSHLEFSPTSTRSISRARVSVSCKSASGNIRDRPVLGSPPTLSPVTAAARKKSRLAKLAAIRPKRKITRLLLRLGNGATSAELGSRDTDEARQTRSHATETLSVSSSSHSATSPTVTSLSPIVTSSSSSTLTSSTSTLTSSSPIVTSSASPTTPSSAFTSPSMTSSLLSSPNRSLQTALGEAAAEAGLVLSRSPLCAIYVSADGKTRSRRDHRRFSEAFVKCSKLKEEAESDTEERKELRRKATRALRMVRKETVDVCDGLKSEGKITVKKEPVADDGNSRSTSPTSDLSEAVPRAVSSPLTVSALKKIETSHEKRMRRTSGSKLNKENTARAYKESLPSEACLHDAPVKKTRSSARKTRDTKTAVSSHDEVESYASDDSYLPVVSSDLGAAAARMATREVICDVRGRRHGRVVMSAPGSRQGSPPPPPPPLNSSNLRRLRRSADELTSKQAKAAAVRLNAPTARKGSQDSSPCCGKEKILNAGRSQRPIPASVGNLLSSLPASGNNTRVIGRRIELAEGHACRKTAGMSESTTTETSSDGGEDHLSLSRRNRRPVKSRLRARQQRLSGSALDELLNSVSRDSSASSSSILSSSRDSSTSRRSARKTRSVSHNMQPANRKTLASAVESAQRSGGHAVTDNEAEYEQSSSSECEQSEREKTLNVAANLLRKQKLGERNVTSSRNPSESCTSHISNSSSKSDHKLTKLDSSPVSLGVCVNIKQECSSDDDSNIEITTRAKSKHKVSAGVKCTGTKSLDLLPSISQKSLLVSNNSDQASIDAFVAHETSIGVLKKKATITRRRASNPKEERLNNVLGSIAMDFGSNIDEVHYTKIERDLALGNKSPEKCRKQSCFSPGIANHASSNGMLLNPLGDVTSNSSEKDSLRKTCSSSATITDIKNGLDSAMFYSNTSVTAPKSSPGVATTRRGANAGKKLSDVVRCLAEKKRAESPHTTADDKPNFLLGLVTSADEDKSRQVGEVCASSASSPAPNTQLCLLNTSASVCFSSSSSSSSFSCLSSASTAIITSPSTLVSSHINKPVSTSTKSSTSVVEAQKSSVSSKGTTKLPKQNSLSGRTSSRSSSNKNPSRSNERKLPYSSLALVLREETKKAKSSPPVFIPSSFPQKSTSLTGNEQPESSEENRNDSISSTEVNSSLHSSKVGAAFDERDNKSYPDDSAISLDAAEAANTLLNLSKSISLVKQNSSCNTTTAHFSDLNSSVSTLNVASENSTVSHNVESQALCGRPRSRSLSNERVTFASNIIVPQVPKSSSVSITRSKLSLTDESGTIDLSMNCNISTSPSVSITPKTSSGIRQNYGTPLNIPKVTSSKRVHAMSSPSSDTADVVTISPTVTATYVESRPVNFGPSGPLACFTVKSTSENDSALCGMVIKTEADDSVCPDNLLLESAIKPEFEAIVSKEEGIMPAKDTLIIPSVPFVTLSVSQHPSLASVSACVPRYHTTPFAPNIEGVVPVTNMTMPPTPSVTPVPGIVNNSSSPLMANILTPDSLVSASLPGGGTIPAVASTLMTGGPVPQGYISANTPLPVTTTVYLPQTTPFSECNTSFLTTSTPVTVTCAFMPVTSSISATAPYLPANTPLPAASLDVGSLPTVMTPLPMGSMVSVHQAMHSLPQNPSDPSVTIHNIPLSTTLATNNVSTSLTTVSSLTPVVPLPPHVAYNTIPPFDGGVALPSTQATSNGPVAYFDSANNVTYVTPALLPPVSAAPGILASNAVPSLVPQSATPTLGPVPYTIVTLPSPTPLPQDASRNASVYTAVNNTLIGNQTTLITSAASVCSIIPLQATAPLNANATLQGSGTPFTNQVLAAVQPPGSGSTRPLLLPTSALMVGGTPGQLTNPNSPGKVSKQVHIAPKPNRMQVAAVSSSLSSTCSKVPPKPVQIAPKLPTLPLTVPSAISKLPNSSQILSTPQGSHILQAIPQLQPISGIPQTLQAYPSHLPNVQALTPNFQSIAGVTSIPVTQTLTLTATATQILNGNGTKLLSQPLIVTTQPSASQHVFNIQSSGPSQFATVVPTSLLPASVASHTIALSINTSTNSVAATNTVNSTVTSVPFPCGLVPIAQATTQSNLQHISAVDASGNVPQMVATGLIEPPGRIDTPMPLASGNIAIGENGSIIGPALMAALGSSRSNSPQVAAPIIPLVGSNSADASLSNSPQLALSLAGPSSITITPNISLTPNLQRDVALPLSSNITISGNLRSATPAVLPEGLPLANSSIGNVPLLSSELSNLANGSQYIPDTASGAKIQLPAVLSSFHNQTPTDILPTPGGLNVPTVVKMVPLTASSASMPQPAMPVLVPSQHPPLSVSLASSTQLIIPKPEPVAEPEEASCIRISTSSDGAVNMVVSKATDTPSVQSVAHAINSDTVSNCLPASISKSSTESNVSSKKQKISKIPKSTEKLTKLVADSVPPRALESFSSVNTLPSTVSSTNCKAVKNKNIKMVPKFLTTREALSLSIPSVPRTMPLSNVMNSSCEETRVNSKLPVVNDVPSSSVSGKDTSSSTNLATTSVKESFTSYLDKVPHTASATCCPLTAVTVSSVTHTVPNIVSTPTSSISSSTSVSTSCSLSKATSNVNLSNETQSIVGPLSSGDGEMSTSEPVIAASASARMAVPKHVPVLPAPMPRITRNVQPLHSSPQTTSLKVSTANGSVTLCKPDPAQQTVSTPANTGKDIKLNSHREIQQTKQVSEMCNVNKKSMKRIVSRNVPKKADGKEECSSREGVYKFASSSVTVTAIKASVGADRTSADKGIVHEASRLHDHFSFNDKKKEPILKRSLFRTRSQEDSSRNSFAFSAVNESSVYAFEPDSEAQLEETSPFSKRIRSMVSSSVTVTASFDRLGRKSASSSNLTEKVDRSSSRSPSKEHIKKRSDSASSFKDAQMLSSHSSESKNLIAADANKRNSRTVINQKLKNSRLNSNCLPGMSSEENSHDTPSSPPLSAFSPVRSPDINYLSNRLPSNKSPNIELLKGDLSGEAQISSLISSPLANTKPVAVSHDNLEQRSNREVTVATDQHKSEILAPKVVIVTESVSTCMSKNSVTNTIQPALVLPTLVTTSAVSTVSSSAVSPRTSLTSVFTKAMVSHQSVVASSAASVTQTSVSVPVTHVPSPARNVTLSTTENVLAPSRHAIAAVTPTFVSRNNKTIRQVGRNPLVRQSPLPHSVRFATATVNHVTENTSLVHSLAVSSAHPAGNKPPVSKAPQSNVAGQSGKQTSTEQLNTKPVTDIVKCQNSSPVVVNCTTSSVKVKSSAGETNRSVKDSAVYCNPGELVEKPTSSVGAAEASATKPKVVQCTSIAIQCDMDEVASSAFRHDIGIGSDSGTQTEGPSKLPLPPSASPFYYLPLAMAALGEKLPAQLVQQMLAKTQGLVGAAEAGMILQQAAQLAQQHQQKMQQQATLAALLPEPPGAKPVQTVTIPPSLQGAGQHAAEQAIIVHSAPVETVVATASKSGARSASGSKVSKQNTTTSVSTSVTIMKTNTSPATVKSDHNVRTGTSVSASTSVVAADKALPVRTNKSVTLAQSNIDTKFPIRNLTLSTVSSSIIKSSPPVYITPPSRITVEAFNPTPEYMSNALSYIHSPNTSGVNTVKEPEVSVESNNASSSSSCCASSSTVSSSSAVEGDQSFSPAVGFAKHTSSNDCTVSKPGDEKSQLPLVLAPETCEQSKSPDKNRLKQSRSHSLEKESSNKKLKVCEERKDLNVSENKSIDMSTSNRKRSTAEGLIDKSRTDPEQTSKKQTTTTEPPADCSPKKTIAKSTLGRNMRSSAKQDLASSGDEERNSTKSRKSRSPTKRTTTTGTKASESPEKPPNVLEDRKSQDSSPTIKTSEAATPPALGVRRSARSSTSASTRATESDQQGAELIRRHRRAKRAAAALAAKTGDDKDDTLSVGVRRARNSSSSCGGSASGSGWMSPSASSDASGLPPPLSPQLSPDTLRGWPPPRLTSPSPSQSSEGASSTTSQRSSQRVRQNVSLRQQSPQARNSVHSGRGSGSSDKQSGGGGGSWTSDPLLGEQAPPKVSDNPMLTRAPSFFPSAEEFNEPLDYIEKIRPEAERFGICRIVPPASFRPECRVNDDMRFVVNNQYIHRLMRRWGPNVRQTAAIRLCLAKQNIELISNPLIGGLEIDLVQLYRAVEQLGGLMTVLEEQLWSRVAQLCRIPKTAQDRLAKLDAIYCKYLLPYATLSHCEREELLKEADQVLARLIGAISSRTRGARMPARRNTSTDSNSSSDDDDGEDDEYENLDCFTLGKSTSLASFYRLARNTTAQWLPDPNGLEVDARYWSIVTEGTRHVSVLEANIDTSEHGYGFPSPKTGSAARHPWNLKNLCQSSSNLLRSMGSVIGVTAPTLHVGMLFSTVCWYRDPHSLPWIEYLHSGASKIWYGVSATAEKSFRGAMQKIVPEFVKDSPIWLPADTTMVDPSELAQLGVPVCRVVQEPGQFVIVFPGAFTSSLCTGYLIAESVFFARHLYLDRAQKCFELLAECSEPAMFSLERLVCGVATDSRATLDSLVKARPLFSCIVRSHTLYRGKLNALGVKREERFSAEQLAGPGRSTSNSGGRRGGTGSRQQQQRRLEAEEATMCAKCRQEQYLAMVVDELDNSVYCVKDAVEHVTDVWNEEKCDTAQRFKLLYRHTNAELSTVLQQLEERLLHRTSKRFSSSPGKLPSSLPSTTSPVTSTTTPTSPTTTQKPPALTSAGGNQPTTATAVLPAVSPHKVLPSMSPPTSNVCSPVHPLEQAGVGLPTTSLAGLSARAQQQMPLPPISTLQRPSPGGCSGSPL